MAEAKWRNFQSIQYIEYGIDARERKMVAPAAMCALTCLRGVATIIVQPRCGNQPLVDRYAPHLDGWIKLSFVCDTITKMGRMCAQSVTVCIRETLPSVHYDGGQ